MELKKIILISVIPVLCLGLILFGYINYCQKKKAIEEKELRYIYKQQNEAFVMNCNLADMNYYHGSDEIKLHDLTIALYVYSLDNPENTITVEAVQEYFSKEYADDGSLMVYSRPKAFDKYIDWWWDGGSAKIWNFEINLVDYLSKNGYDHHYDKFSLEELKNLLPLVPVEE